MRKKTATSKTENILPEYSFDDKEGVRGKYAEALQEGYVLRVLKADGTFDEFDFLIEKARRQATKTKLKKKDIKSAIVKARMRKK